MKILFMTLVEICITIFLGLWGFVGWVAISPTEKWSTYYSDLASYISMSGFFVGFAAFVVYAIMEVRKS